MDIAMLEKNASQVGSLCLYAAFATSLWLVCLKQAIQRRKEASRLEPFFPGEPVVVANHCQHRTALVGEVRAGEHSKTLDLVEKFGSPDKVAHCHPCLEKMSIPCAHCGLPIFAFSRVTTYLVPLDKLSKLHKGAAVFKVSTDVRAVGCHRRGCVRSDADLAAQWYPPGGVLFDGKTELVYPTAYLRTVAVWDGNATLLSESI